MWSLLAKPPMPPTEAKSNQAPNSGLFESGGSRGYTAGGPLSEKWSEIFPQELGRRGLRLDDKSWTSYLRCACIYSSPIMQVCLHLFVSYHALAMQGEVYSGIHSAAAAKQHFM